MEARATAKIKIKAIPEIVRTLKIYQKGLQFCVNEAWKRKIRNNVRLHPFVYKSLMKKGLQSQLAIACIKQACGIVKRAKSKPVISNVSMRYNFPRSASLKRNVLSLATINGRVKIPFSVPKCYRQYFKWNVKESLLRIDKKGRCFFLFTFAKDIKSKSSGFQNRVLGVDVGVNNLAVTSNNIFYGKQIKALRIRHDKLVNRLQAKGTKSAKRHLRKLSGRWRRFMAWTNHNISRRIVDSVPEGTAIVMENLTNIRRKCRYNKWVHKWAFRQLQSFIEYKAVRKRDRVAYGNPYRTSKDCPICLNDLTRHSGFAECSHCGFSLSADLVGSRNLAIRYMRNFGLADITQPIVSDYEGKGSFEQLSLSSGANSQIPHASA